MKDFEEIRKLNSLRIECESRLNTLKTAIMEHSILIEIDRAIIYLYGPEIKKKYTIDAQGQYIFFLSSTGLEPVPFTVIEKFLSFQDKILDIIRFDSDMYISDIQKRIPALSQKDVDFFVQRLEMNGKVTIFDGRIIRLYTKEDGPC